MGRGVPFPFKTASLPPSCQCRGSPARFLSRSSIRLHQVLWGVIAKSSCHQGLPGGSSTFPLLASHTPANLDRSKLVSSTISLLASQALRQQPFVETDQLFR